MSKSKIALGALFGAAAGFITGVLTAPKSGKETREDIKEVAQRTKDDAVVKAGEAKEVATEKAEELRAKAEEVVADVREKSGDVIADVTDKATELKGRTEQAIAGAKKGFEKTPRK